MSRNRRRRRSRNLTGRFLALPGAMLNSPNFVTLSSKSVKLLIDIANQFSGENNGDLQAAWVCMEKRGWKSRDTLNVALHELLHYGFIEKTRQGGLNACSLYALTWLPIDECGDKFDATIKPTHVASSAWKKDKEKFGPPKKQSASPKSDNDRHDRRANEARMAA